jgi:hypothetical protein
MALLISSVVSLLLMHFLSSASQSSVGEHVESISTKWTVDLRAAIGSPPIGMVVGAHGHEYKHLPKTSLWFTDNNTVVATFVTREDKSPAKLSQHDSKDESLRLRLRAVFVDAASGKIQAVPNWSAGSRDASIVVVDDGRFVTRTGDKLTLFSSDLRELKTLDLPQAEEANWHAEPSPSGKNILFIASDLRTRSAVRWVWVETENLRIIKTWDELQSGWVGISDRQIAMTRCVWLYDCEPSIGVKSLESTWKTIRSADRHNMPHPQFLGDDLMVLLTGHEMTVLGSSGEVIWNEDTPFETCWWGGIYPATRGHRFVIPSCKSKGGSTFLDLGGREELTRVFVYDAPYQGRSYVVNLKGSNIKAASLIALSPDGSKLATLERESLSVFELLAPK